MCRHTHGECKDPASHHKCDNAISTTQTGSFVLPILVSVQSPSSSSHAADFVIPPPPPGQQLLVGDGAHGEAVSDELRRWPSSSEVFTLTPGLAPF
jgi:hypothetical protein